MKKILIVILVLAVIAIALGGAGFFFWSDVKLMLGMQTKMEESYLGKPFVFNFEGSTITIPDKFPEDVLERLNQEFIERGGMPLRLEEKGNGLPFGMP